MTKTIHRLLGALLFLQADQAVRAQVEPDVPSAQPSFRNDYWHISVSPYLWLAGLDGNLNVLGQRAAVRQSFGDILSNIKFGVMGLTEVRRGRFGVLTDLLYVHIGDQRAVPIPQLPTSLPVAITSNTLTLTPEVAYRVYRDDRFRVDVTGGFRYYHISAKLNANAGALGQAFYSRANNWVDAIGGARFQVRLTQRTGLFLLCDAGGGGSGPSWQLVTGLGYQLSKRATAQFGYRRLYFSRQDGPGFGFNATQEGFILGITSRFR